MASEEEVVAEGRSFAIPARPGRQGFATTLSFPSHQASEGILLDSCELFQVTKFHLARLLGLPWPAHVYTWLDGSSRPSALYLSRLVRLHMLYSGGVQLRHFRAVDWEEGRLIPYGSPLPKRPGVQAAAVRPPQSPLDGLDALESLGPIRSVGNGRKPTN